MKKNKKFIAVNNQEDEDFETYTLYPENAIMHKEEELRYEKHTADFDITMPLVKETFSAEKDKSLTLK